MVERVEHWFNRRYNADRRDIYLERDGEKWRVVGRIGGYDGREVTHDCADEDAARAVVQQLRDRTESGLADWRLMPQPPRR